jgi:multisubunit Na+/H+ antiporter MnhB subunit
LKLKTISSLIILFTILFTVLPVFSGDVYKVEGYLFVGGSEACTIMWDSYDKVFKVYWEGKSGYTLLFYKETHSNGFVEYTEYESGGSVIAGSFMFRDETCETGKYTRKDGQSFTVKR